MSSSPRESAPAAMSRREVLEAISGLLAGMLVAILSTTVVSTSLPVIVTELGGDQATFTWIITATLLATTVSTPIWGKLADMLDRKLLVQLALAIFVVASVASGFAQDPGTLIAFRAVQGIGAGGLMALVQVIFSDIVSPRERGRYMGLLGGIMALGIAGGPLLGGVITDTIGWRWNFYVAVPVAIVAIILIQRTLHLPKHSRRVKIDLLGAALIAGGVSLLLIWVTLGGSQFEWNSLTSWLMLGGAIALLGLAILIELKVEEPIIPLSLFQNRTFTLTTMASLAVGVGMFGTSVFLSQYLQLSRGMTPTESGIFTLPQVAGMLVASTVAGAVISRTGAWKRWMVTGATLLTVGLALMSTLRYDTPFGLMFLYMAVLGLGVGMLMQNLVLVVQNTVDVSEIGAASAGVAFFRTLGGAAGVAALGAALAARVRTEVESGLVALGISADDASAVGSGSIPDLTTLPEPVRLVIEQAYGLAIGEIFLIAVPLGVLTIVLVALLPNIALGTKNGIQQRAEKDSPLEAATRDEILADTPAELLIEVATDVGGGAPVLDDAERGPQDDDRDAARD